MIDKERATLGHECRHGRSSASTTRIAPFPHVFQISLADVKDKLGKGELASWIRPTNRSGTANRDLAVIDDMIKLNPQLSVHVSKTSALEVDRTPPVSQGPAAAMLGLNRTTLMFRMRKLGIERPFRHVASAGSFMTVCAIWITARNVNAANGPAPNACQPLG